MTNLVKSTVLGLTLLAGAGFAAHAQSGNVAALPPGAAAAPAAAVAPSPAWIGPKASGGWYPTRETQAGAAVQPSPKYVGPSPGGGWYPVEKQTQEVVPSGRYPGPRPN